jgi:PBP1b-binding outer membrane lipoprotein LpoB
MKKQFCIFIISLFLSGCMSYNDPRPPLMSTTTFTDFQPFTEEDNK